MLEADGLTKVFRAARGRRVEAVRNATFRVGAGEAFGLLGPNGAGKTTLLRMLATIIAPTSGVCRVNGLRADEAPDRIRHAIGFLSGNTRLYGRLTAWEVLHYFGRLHGMAEPKIRASIAQMSGMLDMGEFMHRRCDSLSTGQTQKVSIARVLLHEPELLILDEPTLGLDIMTSNAILSFIADAKRRGRAIVFSTHYLGEAEMLCDRVGIINKGDLIAVDTPAALQERAGCATLRDAFVRIIAGREGAAP